MKKTIFIIITLCFIAKVGNSQVTFPMTKAKWYYSVFGDAGSLGDTYISPDTIVEINGKTYAHIVYRPHPHEGSQEIYYREENKRFFVLPKDSANEILVYDFNLKQGDTFQTKWAWSLYDSITLQVTKVDTITSLDGLQRKKIRLKNEKEGKDGEWIEGIGDTRWLFVFPAYNFSVSGGYNFSCHFQNDKIIYTDLTIEFCKGFVNTQDFKTETYFKVSPNPATDHLNIAFSLRDHSSKETELVLYDLAGKEVQRMALQESENISDIEVSHLPSGVYTLHLQIEGRTMAVEKVVIMR